MTVAQLPRRVPEVKLAQVAGKVLAADVIHEHDYDEWCAYDDHWLLVCDVVLRIPGGSAGADREVKIAKNHGIPVVFVMDNDWRQALINVTS